MPSDFQAHPLWFKGPPWLQRAAQYWPEQSDYLDLRTRLDKKEKIIAHVAQTEATWELIDKYSSWAKLLRITAYILRFINTMKNNIQNRRHPNEGGQVAQTGSYLQASDIAAAVSIWVKMAQRDAFASELRDLRAKRPVGRGSPLHQLDPSIDECGIIRVGGRLRNASLTVGQKHPCVLPRHKISDLIIRQVHLNTLHGGTQLTLRVLRQQYWVLSARTSVRSHINQCVICTRFRASVGQQFMADLPAVRTTPSPAFSHAGVDYAGPILVQTMPGRGHRSHKSYISVFVCLATRAIHLELVLDYSSAAFLAAFDRFTSRRGIPEHMYSDNGTTFKGADKELIHTFKQATSSPVLKEKLALDGTTWHFLPPAAPHFGGIWEAGVKSVKHHLKRILNSSTPTAEELSTLFCQIEACLNLRPIAPLRDDIESYDVLTPGNFLIGRPLKTVPHPSLFELNENRLSRWQQMRRKLEQFWRVWQSDYLNSLQQRQKWQVRKQNLEVGNIVLVRNNNLPPSKWELGRVVQCHPGEDKLVRVVTIKTAHSSYVRPVTQLCKLETK